MTRDTLYLSKKGLKELRKTIAKLERELQETQRALRDLDRGDARDERLALTERLAQLDALESELQEKRFMLVRAKQLPRKRDALKVALGSVVDLIDTNGRLLRYHVVESFEANPSDGRISVSSPIGQSLLGRQIQDNVEWRAGNKTNRVQLVAIR